ncbi:MAG: STAS domain-containing protein [Solirubrobacteraceae bacterium]
MTHHLTLSTASQHAHDRSDEAQATSNRAGAGDGETNLSVAARSRPHLTLVRPPVWRHKLILTGKLDFRSASELEEEIECLCQEGVTNLTLDLRHLDAIDPTGATAIAFCGAACRRRGHDLAVIPGSRVIHRALTEAGAAGLLALDRHDGAIRSYSESLSSNRSTTTINHL